MTIVPAGYTVVETGERVGVLGTRMTRRGAERLVRANPPLVPSYHLRIEREGRFKFDVVAYQNRLTPIDRG